MTDYIFVALLVAASAGYLLYKIVKPFRKRSVESSCCADKCANCSLSSVERTTCSDNVKKL